METAQSMSKQRSCAKAKVTTTANRLKGTVKSNNQHSIDHDISSLHDAYEEFCQIDVEFTELINSDTKYDSLRKVGNMDLEQYSQCVLDIYNAALSAHTEAMYKPLEASAILAIANAKKVVVELLSLCEDFDQILMTALLDKATQCNNFCRHLVDKLASSGKTQLIGDLSALISEVEFSILKVEQRACQAAQPRHDVSNKNQSLQKLDQGAGSAAGSGVGSQPASDVACTDPPHNAGGGGGERLTPSDVSVVAAYENHQLSMDLTPVYISTPTHRHMTHQSQNMGRRYKEIPIPTFDGTRLLWGEFRESWRLYANSTCGTDIERAQALKSALKGKASDVVKPIPFYQKNSYEIMWKRLENAFSDVSYTIQFSENQLRRLKQVREDDFSSLVSFVNDVESVFSQLAGLDQVQVVSLHHVDELADKLPLDLRKGWMRVYRALEVKDQIHPFSQFMVFLDNERSIAYRLSERSALKGAMNGIKPKGQSGGTKTFQASSEEMGDVEVDCFAANDKANGNAFSSDDKRTLYFCIVHKSNKTHGTVTCKDFKSLSRNRKYELLKKFGSCFKCFHKHFRSDCTDNSACSKCGQDDHNSLLCKSDISSLNETKSKTSSNVAKGNSRSIYPISQVNTMAKHSVTVFFDGGSNASYILHETAKRIGAKKMGAVTLEVTTMGGKEDLYNTCSYEFRLISTTGDLKTVIAYGMDTITGPAELLDMETLGSLFPSKDVQKLQRTGKQVDILMGNDHFGLHPYKEVARTGKHLKIMEGELGETLQGIHPRLSQSLSLFLVKVKTAVPVATQESNVTYSAPHREFKNFSVRTNAAKCEPNSSVDKFVLGDELGTEVTPKCGGCKCSKCPVVGHSYSFIEQQELDLIRENLKYDDINKRWVASYPWIRDPLTLPDNYGSAFATLRSTEKTLNKDPAWAKVYSEQIEDMVSRNVARKLSKEELEQWIGPKFYISHLAVRNPKSPSTPVRIVFNSSQVFNGVSLNSCLAKGPDSYVNNLMGILLRWRENPVALVADIRKMYNSVFINDLEQHTHRFLWRNLENRDPDVYVIMRVNMGDRPAGAIATEALYKTADLFEGSYPSVSKLLRSSTYVDDVVTSVSSKELAVKLATEADIVLKEAGFKTKSWLLSGELGPRIDMVIPEGKENTEYTSRVLGVQWETVGDVITFNVNLNFSQKKKGVYSEPDINLDNIPEAIPSILTRRKVLEQVMKVFDPLGLLSPFLLTAKQYLRETWTHGLKWDDALPALLHRKWTEFFQQLVEVTHLKYERCLKPENSVGKPMLVILCDGSDLAYGAAVYVRWKVVGGSYWSRLVFAKNRIAPIKRISTPQMELNGAVLAKRARKVAEQEMGYDIEEVICLTDSEIVLSMLNKLSTRFRLYEGVRIGEIQASLKGDMKEWFWVDGKQNIADWLTRPKKPKEISADSEWYQGPRFMTLPVDQWPIKSYSDVNAMEVLPGERSLNAEITRTQESFVDYTRFSSHSRLVWTVAKVISILQNRSFKAGADKFITPRLVEKAKQNIIKDVQASMSELDSTSHGRYKQLKPTKDAQGLWVLGARLSSYNPMTDRIDGRMQYLLPSNHPYTRIAMASAHILGGHRGRDSTLARFRHDYWTPQGSRLASSVKSDCQKCKVRDPKLIQQQMAKLPLDRLQPSTPFETTMLDYFGPFNVKGEVQKRVTGKVWAICFTDLCSRAVHIEPAYGYSTEDFILALTRFTSIRGWPRIIYSDPGSQIVGAERELTEAWNGMDQGKIVKTSSLHGLEWKFGAADSPWKQGAVESLVKTAKRGFKYSMDNRRVSPSEFNTICYQVANMINERPIGTLASSDSIVSILTPNNLLLGRSLADNQSSIISNTYSYNKSIVNDVTNAFWHQWKQLYVPSIIRQSKWDRASPNLSPGDIVLVSDSNALRGQYFIARVKEVFPGKDGKVRTVSLVYTPFKAGEKVHEWPSTRVITRGVQKLALIVPGGE